MPRVTRTILLVDDEKSFLQSLAFRLEREGYRVLTAERGEDGLRIAEEQLPDLILLDILLPGMKGREVCARLKAGPTTADIPVIFLTALGVADYIQAGMAAGAEDYLLKPFSASELKERIMVCLARHKKWEPPE